MDPEGTGEFQVDDCGVDDSLHYKGSNESRGQFLSISLKR